MECGYQSGVQPGGGHVHQAGSPEGSKAKQKQRRDAAGFRQGKKAEPVYRNRVDGRDEVSEYEPAHQKKVEAMQRLSGSIGRKRAAETQRMSNVSNALPK